MKRYIAIDLLALKQHKLSLEEWTLLENIYFMSNNEFGWCYASKNTLREIIQVSNGQIYKIISKLIEKGFLIKNEETGYLKVTLKWIEISSGEGIQKMENTSPKNGDTPLQKMETKKDNIKRDIKKEEKNTKKRNLEHTENQNKISINEIIEFYKKNISSKNAKVKEQLSYNAIVLHQEHIDKIIQGLRNYALIKPKDEQYICNLQSFVRENIYLDYQVLEQKKIKSTGPSVENTKAMIEQLYSTSPSDVIDCEVIS